MRTHVVNLVLVGYRGTGKSSIGAALGRALGWPVVSTDTLVVERLGHPIAEFVAARGWARFRAIEREVVIDAAERDRVVIDTGGGAVLDPESREALKARGFVVWLRASPTTIADRIARDGGRPALRAGETATSEIETVLAEREPIYGAMADCEVFTDLQPIDAAVDAIRARLPGQPNT